MSDTITTTRVEPILNPGSTPRPSYPGGVIEAAPARQAVARVVVREGGPALDETAPDRSISPERAPSVSDQLARLEDKTARIEEKLSRSEAATQRVVDRFETASHRMSEVAQQADLVAVRSDLNVIARRVRNLPGMAATIAAALITAVLSAIAVVLVLRFVPGVSLR